MADFWWLVIFMLGLLTGVAGMARRAVETKANRLGSSSILASGVVIAAVIAYQVLPNA